MRARDAKSARCTVSSFLKIKEWEGNKRERRGDDVGLLTDPTKHSIMILLLYTEKQCYRSSKVFMRYLLSVIAIARFRQHKNRYKGTRKLGGSTAVQ